MFACLVNGKFHWYLAELYPQRRHKLPHTTKNLVSDICRAPGLQGSKQSNQVQVSNSSFRNCQE